MRQDIRRDGRAAGGSISRPRKGIFREAADIAYNFKWTKGDIMDMTRQERLEWLAQIRRIHGEEQRQRMADSESEIARILRLREERENGDGQQS